MKYPLQQSLVKREIPAISLKHLSYSERLKQLHLPTLKYRRLRGDMIQVFKIVHEYYDVCAAVKLNFNTLSTTRGNKHKLQKSASRYNLRKFSFCSRVVNIYGTVCQIQWLMPIRLILSKIV